MAPSPETEGQDRLAPGVPEAEVAVDTASAFGGSPAQPRWPIGSWIASSDLPIRLLAAATALRMEREALWIHRRTERFDFLDGRRVRKTMHIELTVPSSFNRPEDSASPVLPVARPKKRFLRNMQLVDEGGRALPSFTRDENSLISTMMLVLGAQEVLRDDVPEELAFDFADVAGLRWHHGDYPGEEVRGERCRVALDRFRSAALAASETTSARTDTQAGAQQALDPNQPRAALWNDPVTRHRLLQLADNFVLLVPDLGEEGTRRRITFSYEWELDPPADEAWRKIVKRTTPNRLQMIGKLGQGLLRGESIDHIVNLPTRGIFAAASYHAEVLAPEDLVVVGSRLQLLTQERDKNGNVERRWQELAADRGTPLVHLYANGRRPVSALDGDSVTSEIAQLGLVRIRFRIRAGLVMPVVLTAAVVAATLCGGLIARVLGYRADNATTAAVLVALPAVYAAYLLPQGHALMRRLFLTFRSVLVILAILPYAAATTLALDMGHTLRYVLWSIFCAVALVCLIASLAACARALRITFDRPPTESDV
jgi:hypothetical protein